MTNVHCAHGAACNGVLNHGAPNDAEQLATSCAGSASGSSGGKCVGQYVAAGPRLLAPCL